MELCVENVEKRSAMEEDLSGARDILKSTLCDGCKTNLKKNGCHKKPTISSKKSKKQGGISLKGKGSAFIMSLLAVSVAIVAIAGTGTKIEKTNLVGKVPDVPSIPADLPQTDTFRRNLKEIEEYQTQTALQVYEPDSLPNHQEIENMLK